MYPFHRQHQYRHNSSRSQHGSNGHGGRNSRDRKNSKDKEWRSESEPPSPTNELPPSPNPSRHHRTCQELGLDFPSDQNNALRAKKKVLLSSLCSSDERRSQDNKLRLGPNRYNVFECLQKASDISSRLLEEENGEKERNKHLNEERSNKTEGELPRTEKINSEGNTFSRTENIRNSPELSKYELKGSNTQDHSCISAEEQVVSKNLQINNESSDSETTNNSTSTSIARLKSAVKLTNERKPISENSEIRHFDSVSETKYFSKIDPCKQEEYSSKTSSSLQEKMNDDVNEEDIELMELDNAVSVLESQNRQEGRGMVNTPIDLFAAIELKKVVLDSATAQFSPQWLGQGFAFNTNHKLRYGFVQKKGGSCGVLATVQAFLLKNLLFEENACSCKEPLRPTSSEVRLALVRALTDILWRAGLGESATLTLCSEEKHLNTTSKYHEDGLTETLNLTYFDSRELLEEGIKNKLEQFTDTTGNGCLLFVLSVVLSRGLHRVKSDMDECNPLIGENGHCTLELVTLLLTGSAVSNVFDNGLQLDSCWLRGVNARADIGFLSLFEHYNSCQVGSYLKTPRYPIWVVCSENHFSVLFSCRHELVSDWRAEKHFNLYYYDTMAFWKDEIKLTVDTTGLHTQGHREGLRTPPLEHCIRTKWKDASIDWNGNNPD